MLCKLSKLFKDPDIQYPLDHQMSFTSYIDSCKQLITATRLDLDKNAEKIIEANIPFELYPNKDQKVKTGALLIHGLMESPFQMRDIANYLQSQGLLVKAILLPGHGTIPGALLHVHYQQWLDTVHYGFKKLLNEVDRIFLIGNSTGASLAFYHALQDEKIAGLILISPALKLRNPFAPINSAHKLVSWACKRAEWFHVDSNETIDYVKYRSLPFNAVDQVYQLSKKIRNDHSFTRIKIPLFFAVSMEDASIHAETVIKYLLGEKNKKDRLIIYSAKPVAYSDDRITVRASVYPPNIISMSHISLMINPDNLHYGKKGDYIYASHVDDIKNQQIYGEFTATQLELNRFLVKHHLSSTTKLRLTYNPDFDYLATQIGQFINKSGS